MKVSVLVTKELIALSLLYPNLGYVLILHFSFMYSMFPSHLCYLQLSGPSHLHYPKLLGFVLFKIVSSKPITLYPQFRNTDSSIFPASQATLLEWVAWLGGAKRLQPKTIKSYITYLQSAHMDAACHSQHVSRQCSSASSEASRGTWESESEILSCPSCVMCLQAYWPQQSISNLSSKLNFEG